MSFITFPTESKHCQGVICYGLIMQKSKRVVLKCNVEFQNNNSNLKVSNNSFVLKTSTADFKYAVPKIIWYP